MTILQTILAALNWNVRVTENFETVSAAGIFGKRQSVTTGLTWGYYGGLFNGNTISDNTVSLTNNADNYIVVKRSSGVVSVSTTTTNWLDGAYARLYKVTTVSSAVTAVVDARHDLNGLFFPASIGRHAVYISAAAMQPSVSGGCAALAAIATSANHPDIVSLDFDPTTQEYAQFAFAMPKGWNEGTVTFAPIWSHPATTTNFGVVFDLQAIAISNDDAIDTAFGTAQTSTDTGGTTSDLYQGPESSAITIAGTPAAEDVVFFRISRVTGNGSDTMAVDARLHGIVLYITLDAGTDS